MAQDGEATLWCNVTGKPPPRVTWEWGGQPVRAEAGLLLRNQGQSLHVGRAQAAHSGRYTCVAENVAGRAERRFALSVLGEDPQRAGGGRDAGPAGENKARSSCRYSPWFSQESGLLLGEALNPTLKIKQPSFPPSLSPLLAVPLLCSSHWGNKQSLSRVTHVWWGEPRA